MNTENINEDSENIDEGGSRPLGYWLRTVDALLTREFATAFDGEGVSRRDWMLLNVVSGDIKAPGFAERLARKGKRLRGLEDRGWVEEAGDGTWTLTDEGRSAKVRLGAIVDSIRARVAGAVSPEDFATTLASLEAIARELGWDESQPMRRPGFGRGFSRGGRGFGPPPFGRGIPEGFGGYQRFGFGPGTTPEDAPFDGPHGHDRGHGDHGHGGFGPWGHGGHDGHRHHGRPQHGHGRHGGRDGERAYERGFDAGFNRGQASAS